MCISDELACSGLVPPTALGLSPWRVDSATMDSGDEGEYDEDSFDEDAYEVIDEDFDEESESEDDAAEHREVVMPPAGHPAPGSAFSVHYSNSERESSQAEPAGLLQTEQTEVSIRVAPDNAVSSSADGDENAAGHESMQKTNANVDTVADFNAEGSMNSADFNAAFGFGSAAASEKAQSEVDVANTVRGQSQDQDLNADYVPARRGCSGRMDFRLDPSASLELDAFRRDHLLSAEHQEEEEDFVGKMQESTSVQSTASVHARARLRALASQESKEEDTIQHTLGSEAGESVRRSDMSDDIADGEAPAMPSSDVQAEHTDSLSSATRQEPRSQRRFNQKAESDLDAFRKILDSDSYAEERLHDDVSHGIANDAGGLSFAHAGSISSAGGASTRRLDNAAAADLVAFRQQHRDSLGDIEEMDSDPVRISQEVDGGPIDSVASVNEDSVKSGENASDKEQGSGTPFPDEPRNLQPVQATARKRALGIWNDQVGEHDVTAKDAADIAIEAAIDEVVPGSGDEEGPPNREHDDEDVLVEGAEDVDAVDFLNTLQEDQVDAPCADNEHEGDAAWRNQTLADLAGSPKRTSPFRSASGPDAAGAAVAEEAAAADGTYADEGQIAGRGSVVLGAEAVRRAMYAEAAKDAAATGDPADAFDAHIMTRMESKPKKTNERRAKAATKIQSRIRGRQARRKLANGGGKRKQTKEACVPDEEDLEEIAITDGHVALDAYSEGGSHLGHQAARSDGSNADSLRNDTPEEEANTAEDEVGHVITEGDAWQEFSLNSQRSKKSVRDSFEGKSLSPRSQLKNKKLRRKSVTETEAEQFLNHLREKGDGSVGTAWRRFFDTDGDGALSFAEFCNALVAVDYHGDAVALWRQFGGGEIGTTLGLEVLDPESAGIIEFFRQWCEKTKGGPLEMFYAFDEDGSDCLSSNELAEGLKLSGFFQESGIPKSIDTEEKMLRVLLPLLDRNGRGALQPDELLFLEKDIEKRKRHALAIRRRRQGIVCSEELTSNEALGLLKAVTWETTRGGKRHWKMVKHPLLGSDKKNAISSKQSGTPFASAGSSPASLGGPRRRTPRFLREFREAKRAAEKGALQGDGPIARPRSLSCGEAQCNRNDGLKEVRTSSRIASPAPAKRASSTPSGVLNLREGWLPTSTQADLRRPKSAAKPGSPEHPDSAPAPGGDGAMIQALEPEVFEETPALGQAWIGTLPLRRYTANPKALRASVEAEKSRSRHKAYGATLVPPLPEPRRHRQGRSSTPTSLLPGRRGLSCCGDEAMYFNPQRLDSFLLSSKSRSLCQHYGVC